jgi:arylsulfatase A-like enzyme
MIESADRGIGRIMARLDRLGLAEDTAVFFFSDNGGYAGVTTNKPLRGFKGMLYEGGIREPMFVRWKGRIKPGGVCETPVIGVDFCPTFLEIAGASKPDGQPLDGESLVPLLQQRGPLERKAIFWHFPVYIQAGRGVAGTWRCTPVSVIRQGDWKLLEFFEDGRLELYNLRQDIGERNNLATKRPEKARELHAALRAWRTSVNAPIPTAPNPKYDPKQKPSEPAPKPSP